jgi:hypothetical protein
MTAIAGRTSQADILERQPNNDRGAKDTPISATRRSALQEKLE